MGRDSNMMKLPTTRVVRRNDSASKPQLRLSVDTITWIIVLVCSCFVSFYAGIWVAWESSSYSSTSSSSSSSSSQQQQQQKENATTSTSPTLTDCSKICFDAVLTGQGELGHKFNGMFDDIVKVKIQKALEINCPSTWSKRFPSSMTHFANGLMSINRRDMFNIYDFGVPMNDNAGKENVLMLYDSTESLPSNETLAEAAGFSGIIPETDATTATSNCDVMSAIFVKNPSSTVRQCLAIIGGQYQGYHVQRWARLLGEGKYRTFDKNAPLKLAGRMIKMTGGLKGTDEFEFPKAKDLRSHREILLNYLSNLDRIQTELALILKKIAIDNTVIVSTVNQGQSELLMNFVCSARSRGLDVQNMIIFPTDLYSKALAEQLGLATFFSEELMKSIPSHEAGRYGDDDFARINVDIVWFKNPLEYFHDTKSSISKFDVYFQDDGNREDRYSPYSANSGFYYVRNNERSKMLFRRMMYAGEIVLSGRSHQEILIQQLADLNELIGLKVKVLNRKDYEFPGGYHFNHCKDDNFMRNFVNGKEDPYIFHMSWTLNKVDKLKYLKQMGMWYVKDECANGDDLRSGGDFGGCCSAEPIFSCHYRDKPSIKSCAGSPPKDEKGRSFW